MRIRRSVQIAVLIGLCAGAQADAAQPIGSIPVGNSPYALALNGNSSEATLVNLFPVRNPDGSDGPNVRVLDLVGQQQLRAFRAGTRLVSVSVAESTALVVNEDQDTIRVINTATGLEVGQIAVGSRPSSVIIVGGARFAPPAIESAALSGGVPNAASRRAVISRNASFIGFASDASDLTPGDSNGRRDIFLRNRGNGQVTRASAIAETLNPGAAEAFNDPALSANAATIAFAGSSGQVYAAVNGSGRSVSSNAQGAFGNGASGRPMTPGNGALVFFHSQATNLLPAADGNGAVSDIFVKDLASAGVTLISRGPAGEPTDGASNGAWASDDGQTIVFASLATNIVPASAPAPGLVKAGTFQQVTMMRGGGFGQTRFYVSRNRTSQELGNGDSINARVSPDGRFGVFESVASNLVDGDGNAVSDIFRFEVAGDRVVDLRRVSVSKLGGQANGASRNASISDDGQLITFETDASNLVEPDANGSTDVVVKFVGSGEVLRQAQTTNAQEPNGASLQPSISGDGSTVAFDSGASNLAAADGNNAQDVFSATISAAARNAIASNGTSGDLSFLDLAAGVESATLRVGNDPRAVALHPLGRYAYVALGGDNAVAVVDLAGTPRLVGSVGVGRSPVAIAFAGNGARAAVTNLNTNTLSVLDTSTPASPRLVASVAVGAQPAFLAFGSLEPNLVYVSNQGANYVTVVDVSRPKPEMVRGVIQMGVPSSGLAIGNNGTRLYVAEFRNSANLRTYDLSNLGALDPKPIFDVPGEPDSLTQLNAAGSCATDFYIAEVTLRPGANDGFWGMEVALTREPRALTGGFNLGGGFDGGARNPGFGAFSLAGPQRVTVTVNAQPLAGPIALKVDLLKDGQRLGGVDGTPTAAAPLRFSLDLQAGFHVVAINSTASSGRGTFQLALETPGAFAGGVVVGGFLTRTAAGESLSGFGAFCIPQSQQVAVRLHGITEYGAAAAGELVLTLRDAQRNVLRVIDNGVGGGSVFTLPPAPTVPPNIRWFVDASASNGDGSSSRPFRSISEAIALAQAGDVIFVRNGVYSRTTTGEQLPIGSAGTGTNGLRANVQLIGEGAEGTIIDGENSAGNTLAVPSAGVRVAGFTIKRSGGAGIYVFRSANVLIENNFATGNARFGIGGEGSSGLVVRNNVAVANLETGIAFVGALPAAAPPGLPTHCPAIAAGPYGAYIVNNTANDNRADGILTGGGGNYCLAGNSTHNNGSSGIEFNNRSEAAPHAPLNGAVINNLINGNGAQQFAFAGTGILAAERARIDLMIGNRLSRNRPFAIGIFLDARAGRIADNIVTDSGTSGILVSTRAGADIIESNTVTGSALSGLFVDIQSNVGSIRNNVATGNDRGLSVLDRSTVGTVENNSFDNNGSLGMEVVGASRVDAVSNLSASNNGAANAGAGGGFQVRESSQVLAMTGSRINGNLGQGGVFVSNGSTLTTNATTIDANTTQGVFAIGANSRVTINGGAITNTRRDTAGAGGFGVNSQSGASVSCNATARSGNVAGNVFTASGGSTSGCE